MRYFLILSLLCSAAFADHHEKTDFKFGGLIDAYYMSNLNSSADGAAITGRNYDSDHNDFTLNLLELNFSATRGHYSFYGELNFGQFASQGNLIDNNIAQAYLAYQFKSGFTLSAGKMYTNVGYEVAKSQDNWNYSRSFAFSLSGPFWHEGIALTKTYDSGFGWGAYIYDGWDDEEENNNDKTYSLQLNYSKNNWGVVYNFMTGQENDENDANASETNDVHEVNFSYEVNPAVSLALDYVKRTNGAKVGDDREVSSVVLYANYQHSKKWSFTPRVEMYTESNDGTNFTQVGTSKDLDITGLTLTASYEPEVDTEFRFELRNDSASEEIFQKDGKGEKGQTTASVSWMMRI